MFVKYNAPIFYRDINELKKDYSRDDENTKNGDEDGKIEKKKNVIVYIKDLTEAEEGGFGPPAVALNLTRSSNITTAIQSDSFVIKNTPKS